MQIRELVSEIDELKEIPHFFREESKFGTISWNYSGKKPKGIYLPDMDSREFFEKAQENNPVEFSYIRYWIETIYHFNDVTYAIFNILHEIGHWQHYLSYIQSGHTDDDYKMTFELKRLELLAYRDDVFNNCCTQDNPDRLNECFSSKYVQLPTEQIANQFAINHMFPYCMSYIDPSKCGEQE